MPVRYFLQNWCNGLLSSCLSDSLNVILGLRKLVIVQCVHLAQAVACLQVLAIKSRWNVLPWFFICFAPVLWVIDAQTGLKSEDKAEKEVSRQTKGSWYYFPLWTFTICKKAFPTIPKKYCNRLFPNNSIAKLSFSLRLVYFATLW